MATLERDGMRHFVHDGEQAYIEQLRREGWRLLGMDDVTGTPRADDELDAVLRPDWSSRDVEELEGVGSKLAKTLRSRSLNTFGDMMAVDDETLLAIPGIGPALLRSIREQLG